MSSYSEYRWEKAPWQHSKQPGFLFESTRTYLSALRCCTNGSLSIAVITYVSLETGCFRKSSRAVTTHDDAIVNARHSVRDTQSAILIIPGARDFNFSFCFFFLLD